MPKSAITTPAAYLAAQPEDRRAILTRVRELILAKLPTGYIERINWGMISYEVPLSVYSDTYNGQPLSYIALAAMKRHLAIYLMCVYQDPLLMQRLRDGFAEAGLKLDMGKACLRFRRLEDLALPVVGEIVAATSIESFVAQAKAVRAG